MAADSTTSANLTMDTTSKFSRRQMLGQGGVALGGAVMSAATFTQASAETAANSGEHSA